MPSPLPGRMVTLSEPWLRTARPRLPLPVKSPVATAAVRMPTGLAVDSSKVPSPLPRSTEMSLEPTFPVARSRRPSPLKSPATRSIGAVPRARRGVVAPVVVWCDRGLKRPVAVAQEHRDIVGVGVGDGQVDMAIAEVARHDRERGSRRRRATTASENVPSPLPSQDIDRGSMRSSRSRPGRGCRCRSRRPRWTSECSRRRVGSSARPRNSPRPDWTGW